MLDTKRTLKDFACAIEDPLRPYNKRIEYNAWRRMQKASDVRPLMKVTRSDFTPSDIIVNYGDGYNDVYTRGDSGFGDYLYNLLFKREAESIDLNAQNLAYSDSTTTTSTNQSYTTNTTPYTTIGLDSTNKYSYTYTNDSWVSNTVNATKGDATTMDTKKIFDFNFGPCGDTVRMSMYGLAVKNASGTWVSYDKANGNIMNVEIFNFTGGKYFYKMPVAINDVHPGDIVIHAKKPHFVLEVGEKDLVTVDPVAGEKKVIMLSRSPFGFDFATKVISLFDSMDLGTPDSTNPFGNMLPLMLMSDNHDIGDILPLMLMSGGMGNGTTNPMMMYLLMNKSGDTDPLVLMMMMNQKNN